MSGDLPASLQLRDLRVRLGWSRDHLADRIGITERSLRRMEMGGMEVHPNLLAWLAEVLAGITANPLPPKDWDAWRPMSTGKP